MTITNANTADCTIADWDAHHPVICLMNWEAATAIYQAMGQRNVKTERVACVRHGRPACHFRTTWE